jgi:hypothetical protein
MTGGITGQFQNNATNIDIFDIRADKWRVDEYTNKSYQILNRNSHNCIYIL